jgi:hypothetical protein
MATISTLVPAAMVYSDDPSVTRTASRLLPVAVSSILDQSVPWPSGFLKIRFWDSRRPNISSIRVSFSQIVYEFRMWHFSSHTAYKNMIC